jgi:hypothetical protein
MHMYVGFEYRDQQPSPSLLFDQNASHQGSIPAEHAEGSKRGESCECANKQSCLS